MTNDRNRGIIEQFRANAGKNVEHSAGNNLLLLNHTGARSGRAYTTPVAYHRDGDRLIVVASKGGSPNNPDWYHNLVAHPDITIEVGAEKLPARAVVIRGPEHDRLYEQHASFFPAFHDYKLKTKRTIPVIALETSRTAQQQA